MTEATGHSSAVPVVHPAPVATVSRWRAAIPNGLWVYPAGVVLAGVLGCVPLLLLGADPLSAYRDMVSSSVGSAAALAQTLNRATPLLLGSCAVALALRAGLVNLGVDGQIYAGATAATGVAFALGSQHAGPWATVLMMVAGGLAGASLAAIPAVLKATRGVNELFVTIMLNFVALYFVQYLVTGPWTDPTAGEALSRSIDFRDRLPASPISGAHVGIFIALTATVLCWAWLTYSRRGFEIRSVGVSKRAAGFAGIGIGSVTVTVMLISGLLGGLAGSIEVSGVYGRLIAGLSPDFGLSAMLIAVIARRSLFAVIPIAFVFAALTVGTDSLQRSANLPFGAVLVFQGLVVISILFFEALQQIARSNGSAGSPLGRASQLIRNRRPSRMRGAQ
jgi:simple sugar transport system permease protein